MKIEKLTKGEIRVLKDLLWAESIRGKSYTEQTIQAIHNKLDKYLELTNNGEEDFAKKIIPEILSEKNKQC